MKLKIKTLRQHACIFCVLTVIILASSCEDGLEPQVYDSISLENFPTNEGDVKTAVTAIYHDLRNDQAYGFNEGCRLTNGMSVTDEFDCNWGWVDQTDFLIDSETNFVSIFYNRMLPTVTKITRTIEVIKEAPVGDETKLQNISQLRCIRALIAFDLYDMYGPVPIITDPQYAVDPQKAKSYLPARPSKEEYLSYLTTELQDVIKVLPVSYEASDYGRMTKGVAMTVLLKLYMHEKSWQKAADTSKEIMDLGYYELQTNFTDIWDPKNEQNKEIIWGISNILGQYSNWYLCFVLPSDYVSQQNIPLTRWSGFRMPWAVWDTFEENDKRRNAFVRWYYNGTEIIDGRVVNGNGHMQKGSLPMKYPENPETDGSGSSTDLVQYRYADVLLYRAEALNEVLGPTQESIDIVNALRSRAGVDPINLSDFDKDSFRDRILQERQWELCFEGWRRQDLIRHGKLISNAHDREKIYAEEKHVLFPIPQTAINENSNIQQNPGF